jgi:16S rRNA (cytosine1402-N4)-methyltransferase
VSDDSQEAPKPKRRIRYKGTHPRNFKEKYKERSSDPEMIAKIIAKGGTPAGTHRPIMVTEILNYLDPKPGDLIVDATLGYGGHSTEILKRLQDPKGENHGRLISFDRDPIESAKTEARVRAQGFAESSFTLVRSNYSEITERLKALGVHGQVNGVLADLGLSSMQIDDPSRGFTFKTEGPLDLRMDPSTGEPASALLARATESELTQWLEINSDEPRAKWVAKAILDAQKKSPITTTLQLATVIRAWMKTLSPNTREKEGDTPLRRAFQALRIEVNQEFASLDRFLAALPEVLAKRGKIAILSFHSGEDRRVKKSFQAFHRQSIYSTMSDEFERPSFEEQKENSRSKSAKLRTAQKI